MEAIAGEGKAHPSSLNECGTTAVGNWAPSSCCLWLACSIHRGWQLLSSAHFAAHVMVCVKGSTRSPSSVLQLLWANPDWERERLKGRRKGKSSSLGWQFRFGRQREQWWPSLLLWVEFLKYICISVSHIYLSVIRPSTSIHHSPSPLSSSLPSSISSFSESLLLLMHSCRNMKSDLNNYYYGYYCSLAGWKFSSSLGFNSDDTCPRHDISELPWKYCCFPGLREMKVDFHKGNRKISVYGLAS